MDNKFSPEEFSRMSVFDQCIFLYKQLHEVGNEGFSERLNSQEDTVTALNLLDFINDILSGKFSTAPVVQFDCFNLLLVLLVFGSEKVRKRSLDIIHKYNNDLNPIYFGNQLAKRINETIQQI